jgi:hypothetical protein
MPAFTLQDFINRACGYADQHEGFVDPDTFLRWANVEVRALDLFVARHGWVQKTPVSTFMDVSRDGPTVQLPTNTMCVLGVWEITSNERYRALDYSETISARLQDPLTGPMIGDAREYWVEYVDDIPSIYLYPRPTQGNYIVLTLKYSDEFISLSSSVNFPLGFEERPILGMARRALIKEESDTSAIEKLIAEEDRRIEEECWNRVLANSPKIRKVSKKQYQVEPLYPEASSWRWL